jgi:hypothetical protein
MTENLHQDEAARDPFAGQGWDEPGPAGGSSGTGPKRRRTRVSRRKRRLRRRVGLVMMIAGAAIILAGAWIAVTGFMARGELARARAEVHQLRTEIAAGDLAGARVAAADLGRHAHRAHQLTTGPAWSLAAGLPAGGEPLRTIRGVTTGIDQLGRDALPQLVQAGDVLEPTKLRNPDGSIDLARIVAAAPKLDRAAATMSATTKRIGALPHSTWLHSIDGARRDVAGQLAALARDGRSADLAAHIAPAMLGQDGPRKYFVAFQNDAEARGTGGLPGAFAIVRADHGKLTFTQFENDTTLDGVPAKVGFGPDYDRLYDGANTTTDYRNSNLSAQFPYAAQIWASMWQKLSGEHVDGAIAVDPTALSYLLAVTGPAALADTSQITAGNVVALTQSTVYSRFATDNDARRQYLLAVAGAVSKKIVEAHGSTTSLVKAAGKAAGERRLLVWSADPAVQADIAQTSLAGAIPTTAAPYVGLAIVNDGGNKLDYYLDRSLDWQRTGCGSTRPVTVRIKLTNSAPASGLSAYVTSRSDRHSYLIKPGDNRLEVSYYASAGALMTGVTVGGRAGTAGVGSEHGHPVYTVDLELPRGTSRTIVLHLTEPAGSGDPIVLRQPLVRPLSVSLQDATCR